MPGSTKKRSRKRRSPGRGSIETLPSGKIRALVRAGGVKTQGPAVDPQDFESPTEAEIEAFRLLQEKLDELNASPSSSFTTYAKSWLKRKEDEDVSPTTVETWKSWIRSLDRDPLGAMPIDSVKTADLEGFKRRFKGKRVTARKRLAWMFQVMRDAGNHARCELPRREESRRRPLTIEEREKLLEALRHVDDELRLMVLLNWEFMGRREDAAGLKHEDRDGEGAFINRVVVAVTGGIEIREKAKSDRGNTWVPLSPDLQALVGHGKGWVLPDPKNPKNPVSPRRITNRVSYFMQKTGLKVPYMGPHTLRRTGGMELLESGVDVVTAAEIMRHDKRMLLDEYTKSRQDLKLAAMRKVHLKTHAKTHEDVK